MSVRGPFSMHDYISPCMQNSEYPNRSKKNTSQFMQGFQIRKIPIGHTSTKKNAKIWKHTTIWSTKNPKAQP